MLDKGNKPALYNLLILDAESSMNKRSFSLVVIKSYQALEVFLESFIYNGYIKLGKSEEETEKLLNKKWRTKERLKEVIKDITDVNFPDQNNELWQEWCTNYENIRKSVFHKSKEVSETEAKKTLEINKEIIKQISKSKIKETQ